MMPRSLSSSSKLALRSFGSLVMALALGAGGCASEDGDEEASATVTSALQAQSQGGVTDGVVDIEGTLAPEPEEAAAKVTDFPTRGLEPAGCATKTRVNNVVTLKLDKCNGPFGKVVIEGSLIATFSKTAADILHVDVVSGEGTIANGQALHYAANADVRFDGVKRHLTYHGDSSGKTKRGLAFERHTDLTIVVDTKAECADIDGVSKGSVGRTDVDLTIEGVHACRHVCPTKGSAHATVNGPLIKNTSIEVAFDGSDQAHVTIQAKKKRERDITLDCDAAEAAE